MKAVAVTLALLIPFACSSNFLDTPLPPPPPPGTPALQLVRSVLSSPVFATSPPGDMLRLFVVEQGGRVRVIRRDTLLTTPFLDLRGKIASGGERGLLSLAFHPQYATNGRFYVYFTNLNGDIRIVRYLRSAADSNAADSLSADTVLAVAHPGQANHNGGQLAFGPDGMLYAGLGDGGGGGDPNANGQNRHALLGKLLRLNVDGASGYTIPGNNPFGATDTSAAHEIWALGMRNPWRFSFDRQTGDLYIADVGQGAWEEVDVEAAGSLGGVNYGWNVMEGRHCYNTACSFTGFTLPLIEYDHGAGCSITGGYVYRGARATALSGQYLYSDYCTHFVRSFIYSGGQATQPHDWTAQLDPGSSVSSFAQDGRGDVYIITLGGLLYRIVVTP